MRGVRLCVVVGLAGALAGGSAGPVPAAFPGKPGRIAFASLRDGNYELYEMQPDTSDLTRLTKNPAADIQPAWSPDGQRLAFASDRAGNPDIWVLAPGSDLKRLTTSDGADFDPDWAPDGGRIAFTSRRDGNDEIYLVTADGSREARLTNAPGSDADPSWSPDGKTIAFSSDRGGALSIYRMDPEGANMRRLTLADGSDVSPSWSPDGSQIAFSSNRDGNYEIYVMNADGSGQKRLTRNLAADLDPAWSADGKQIAFTSTRDANYEIYVMDADGTGQLRLTTSEAEDTTASWESIPIPPGVVGSAAFHARWRQSLLFGTLDVQGDLPAAVTVDLALRQGTRVYLAARLDLPAGPFDQSLKLPRTLLPGAYVLAVTPAPDANYSPQELDLELAPPAEGIVTEAYASTNPGGVPVLRFPPGTSQVFSQFRFLVPPRSGLRVTVSWYRPGGRLVKRPVPKPPSTLVVSYVRGTRGAPLPRGTWRSVLRAGRAVVKQVLFRVG